MTTPLTDVELQWLKNHPDLARSIITPDLEIAPAETEVDYVTAAALSLTSSVDKKARQVRAKLERLRAQVERYTGDSEMADFAAEDTKDIAVQEVELARLVALQQSLLTPYDVFLPIGAIVRFVEHSNDIKDYPVPGTEGVVSALSLTGDLPIAVSVRNPYRDGWNTNYHPQDDRLPTYRVERDRLEVIGYALLPDGSQSTGYQFLETITNDDNEGEMIFHALGHYWRLHDFEGTQGIEVLQAYENLNEMSWLDSDQAEQFTQLVDAQSPKPVAP